MVDSFRARSRSRIYHEEINSGYYNSSFTEKGVQKTSDEFAQDCLRSHNHYRAQHGCPPLHLSADISRFSQQWADQIASEDHLYHSYHPQYGENLFVIYLSDNSLPMFRGSEVVDSWYSEHVFYAFDAQVTKDTITKAGHFTQVVWSSSQQLGIGKAMSSSNRVYVVANYYPAGNLRKKFAANVPRRIMGSSCARSHYHSYSNRKHTSRQTLGFHNQNLFCSWIEC